MASLRVCRTWYRLMPTKEVKILVLNAHSRSYGNRNSDGSSNLFHRVKKFVFGEEELPDLNEGRGEESYYQLVSRPAPPIYNMTPSDIKATIERTCSEMASGSQDLVFTDNVLKFRVLNKCYEEFGLLVPNWQLKHICNLNGLLQFYVTAEPEDTRTFKSIDLEQLPPNLTIGGQVPRKET